MTRILRDFAGILRDQAQNTGDAETVAICNMALEGNKHAQKHLVERLDQALRSGLKKRAGQ